MGRYALVVTGLLTLAACGPANPPRTLPAAITAATLPDAAKEALNTAWPHSWSIASLSPSVATCLNGKAGTIATSDFDSDLSTDIAAAVTTPQGIRLVVLLARDDHYAVFNVDGLTGEQGGATQGIGLAKRGVQYAKANSSFVDFYSTDTLTVYTCAGPVASYVWGGLDFHKVALGTRP